MSVSGDMNTGVVGGSGMIVDSPLIIDVVNHHVATDQHTIDSQKVRVISEETGNESRVMKNILTDYQGRFSIFRDGILKLKHYYDTQMMLIKSHFHGGDDQSYPTSSSNDALFGKLVQIMGLAFKQILSLMESTDMTRSFDHTINVVHTDDVGDIDVTERKMSQKLSVDESRQGTSGQYFPTKETLNQTIDQPPAAPFAANASCSILSPQFDLSYDTSQEDIADPETLETQSPTASNSTTFIPPQTVSNSTNVSTSQQRYFDPRDPKNTEIIEDLNRYNPVMLQDGGNDSITTANDYLATNISDFGLPPPSGTVDQFVCPYCRFIFTTKRDLNRHLRSHTGEKPFHCEVCSKYFARKDFLTKHKLTHTGEKPYSCEQCTKRFSQRSNLNKHMLTHTKDHKHVCKICYRGFHQMINLHRHEQIHCNVTKQFQCVWCTKMAYQGPDCFKTFLDKRENANS